MISKIVKFFDRLEDVLREGLSLYPILYALVGGFSTVLLWRSVWHTADILMESGNSFFAWFFYEPNQIWINTIFLLMIGLFVSIFVGPHVLISGLRKERSIEEKVVRTEKEEEITLTHVILEIRKLQKQVEDLNSKIAK